MKTVLVYECERCNTRYDKAEDAQRCEARHYGLTMENYLRWRALNKTAIQAGRTVACSKNQATDDAFELACKKLAAFEEKHGLTDVPVPRDFV